jgi:hypothetical protein
MTRLYNRLRILLLALFVLGVGASWAYSIMVLRPRNECLARGHWWSNKKRQCAIPVDITQITGRPKGAPAPAQPPAKAAPAQP